MREELPGDFAERIAQLMVDGRISGFLRPRPIELLRKRHPPIQAIDLDVVLLGTEGHREHIDFAIPDVTSFREQAAHGELNLNGRMYLLHWLGSAESKQADQEYFNPSSPLLTSPLPERIVLNRSWAAWARGAGFILVIAGTFLTGWHTGTSLQHPYELACGIALVSLGVAAAYLSDHLKNGRCP
jgi:hypothetical protein